MAGQGKSDEGAGEKATDPVYCLGRLRRHDRQRYNTILFAGPPERRRLGALYAFNLEIATIAEAVSEPLPGAVRLQWWRHAVEGLFAGQPPRQAVVGELGMAVRDCALEQEALLAMIEARERDLDSRPFADVGALEDYARQTAAPLGQLAFQCLQAGRHDDGAGAAAEAATAYALAGVLSAMPWRAAHGLPVLAGYLTADGKGPGGRSEIIRQKVARRLGLGLAKARDLVPRPARRWMPVFLLAGLAQRRIKALATGQPVAPVVSSAGPLAGLAWDWLWRRY